jgi:serine protease Do
MMMKRIIHRFGKICTPTFKSLTMLAMIALLSGLVVAARGALNEPLQTDPRPDVTNNVASRPQSLVALTRQLSPSVVNIRVTRLAKQSQWLPQAGEETPFSDLLRRFFESGQPEHEDKLRGAGSGVLISKEGHILTNYHVIADADEVTVTTADQKTYEASVVGSDPKTDLAVLKIDPPAALTVAKMGDSDRLMVGEWVMAIGNPFGLGHTVTTGIVSGKGRIIGAGPYDDFIQTDASINPGNSGGPLFNMQGELIGINTAIIPQGQGIGFAIPVNTAKPLIPQLVEHGYVTRGFLGVSIQDMSSDLSKALHTNDEKGALVADVAPDSPADEAGVMAGDIILTYDQKPVETARKLSALVANTPVGQEVTLGVVRQSRPLDIKLAVGQLASAQRPRTANKQAAKSLWGLYLRDLPAVKERHQESLETDGVMVIGVEPSSPAQKAGVRRGDVIEEINQQRVTSVEEAKSVLAHAEPLDAMLVRLKRGEAKRYVALAR